MRISNHKRYVRARDEKGKGRRWRTRGGVGNWTLTHRQIEIPRRHASRSARPVQNPDSAPRLTVKFQGLGQGWGRFNQSSNDTLSRQSCCWSRLVRGLVLVRSNLLGRARAQRKRNQQTSIRPPGERIALRFWRLEASHQLPRCPCRESAPGYRRR